ncbi:hypothetical protein BH10BAC2_BH10BAC2_44010 [soil metagenome]
MLKTKSGFIFQLIIFFSFLGCQNQNNISKEVNILVQKERKDDEELFEKFKGYGEDAIPYLIAVIDKEEKGFLGFNDPLSSKLYLFNYNYVGLRAAYMIELILADTSNYKIYEYAVIVKKEFNEPQMTALSAVDMKELKNIYEKWWDSNKLKPLKELSKEWKANKRIIDGSSYLWK